MGNCLYYLQLPFTKSGENLRRCPIFKDISYVVWAMLSDWNFNGRIIPSSHNCWLREFSWNGEGSIILLPQGNILAVETFGAKRFFQFYEYACLNAGLHKLWYPSIRDTSTWSKFGANGEHGDVFLFSNLGALWFSENLFRYSLHVCLREVKNNLFSFRHSYLRYFSWRF